MPETFGGNHGASCGHCGAHAVGAESAHVCVKCGTAEVAGASISLPATAVGVGLIVVMLLLGKRLLQLKRAPLKPLTA